MVTVCIFNAGMGAIFLPTRNQCTTDETTDTQTFDERVGSVLNRDEYIFREKQMRGQTKNIVPDK